MFGHSRRLHGRILTTLAAVAGAVVFSSAVQPSAVRAANSELDRAGEFAKQLAEHTGIRRGVCAVLGSGHQVPLQLARASELLVYAREPDAAAARRLRQEADNAGFGIERLVVEHGPIGALPFADNTLDIVVVTQASSDVLAQLSFKEVLRVLRPEGIAIVGTLSGFDNREVDGARLNDWVRQGGGGVVAASAPPIGDWVEIHKPPLDGADDWSHWEKGPDNNPVSADRIIKAPYMTQFMSEPLYIGMPSITTAAGGRTFLAIGHIAHHAREWESLNKLIARNGYNGTVLWERPLPAGYVVHRSAFIATRDVYYMIDGNGCLMLDPQTGQEQGRIQLPGVNGDWKWMAMQDGVLYVLAGKREPGEVLTKGDRSFGGWSWADLSKAYYEQRIPYGFGDELAAYDLAGKQTIWTHREQSLIDSRGMALRDGKMYLYCPDRHLRGLDAKSGDVIWTNDDSEVLGLIERPGRNLTSTPGFRTACMLVATPKALIIQGQTRMNVISLSTEDGRLLWTKKKITNNPNAIYVDGAVVLGVGPGGSHVAVDPVTGEILEDLRFMKTACTRLTASPDSFFCRGEGTLRYDREYKKVLIDGGARPGCNDGAMPANGLLYIGPWQCDCNLSLIGRIAKCSAGDFRFDHVATEAERLTLGDGELDDLADFEISPRDWPTYRGNNRRSAGTPSTVKSGTALRWQFPAERSFIPTPPVAAGGLVFVGGSDGKVRAIDTDNGQLRWEFATPGPVKQPPTVWDRRVYFGSADGRAYCLEAATGRLLWQFRAAPVERYIMVYGAISSTWPVHSGVLVEDGVAYFAAGIIDYDGTYVYALDAKTGQIKWQNNSSGHLNAQLRKGVSVQGNLSLLGDRLLMAGGNQVSPAAFDIHTGQCLAEEFEQGRPKANNGRFVGVFGDDTMIAGGKILYSAPRNVPTKGGFVAFAKSGRYGFNNGSVPPAWDERSLAMVNFQDGKLTCCDAQTVAAHLDKGLGEDRQRPRDWLRNVAVVLEKDGSTRWQTDLGQPNRFEVVSLAVCPNAVVAVLQYQQRFRSQPQRFVVAVDSESGQPMFQQELHDDPLPDGLLVDRHGQVIVTMIGGNVICLGPSNEA